MKIQYECSFCEDARESLQATRVNGVYAGFGAVPCPKCCKPEIVPQADLGLLLALDELISDYPGDCDRVGNVARVAKRALIDLSGHVKRLATEATKKAEQ